MELLFALILLASFGFLIISLIGLIHGRVWFLRSRKQVALGLLIAFLLFIISVAATPTKTFYLYVFSLCYSIYSC